MLDTAAPATQLHFFSGESVRIFIPAYAASSVPQIVMIGRVARAAHNLLYIVLDDAAREHSALLPGCTDFTICKTTPFGIIEFEATGNPHWLDETLTLQVTLLGTHHRIQRRASFRIELRSEVRYRSLAANAGPDWKTAELHDVSLGGASLLLLQDDALQLGHQLTIEFSLIDKTFSVSSVVRRVELQKGTCDRLLAVEYLDLGQKQQNSMARAMIELQVMVINSRVKMD